MHCSETYMVFAPHVLSALIDWTWCLVVPQLSEPIWFTNQRLKQFQAGYIAYCSLQTCKEAVQSCVAESCTAARDAPLMSAVSIVCLCPPMKRTLYVRHLTSCMFVTRSISF